MDSVFANKRAVLHKGSSGKSMGAFPDTCLCPPPSPAGPVPTPLPNHAMASDLDRGAKSVLVEGNPIGIETSVIKTSTGNEPSKPTGGGVVSHATKGKMYFMSYSFDVLAEGKGVIRHMDIGTHNHQSMPGNTPPWPAIASQDVKGTLDCAEKSSSGKCELSPYNPDKCPEGKTPHHIVPAHSFLKRNAENPVRYKFPNAEGKLPTNRALNQAKRRLNGRPVTQEDIESSTLPGFEKYRSNRAPCVCVTGSDKSSGAALEETFNVHDQPENQLQHGWIHRRYDLAEAKAALGQAPYAPWTLGKAMAAATEAVTKVMPWCDKRCIAKALEDYHLTECGMTPEQELRPEAHSDEWIKETEKLIQRADDRGRELRTMAE